MRPLPGCCNLLAEEPIRGRNWHAKRDAALCGSERRFSGRFAQKVP
jgi:hypothetical protein